MKKEQYEILNILRGISAFMVVFYHFCIYFFAYPRSSASFVKTETVYLSNPFYLTDLLSLPIHMQPLMVFSFFLISGFLILPSLERYPNFPTYLLHKFLRLWPTFAVCFGTAILFLAAFSLYRDVPFPYSINNVLSCFTWTRDILDYRLIDGSFWTLEVQVKFYLLAGIVWYTGRKYFVEKLCFWTLLLSLIVYGFYILGDPLEEPPMIKMLRHELQIIAYITLGTCLYAFHKKQLSWVRTLFLCAILCAAFVSPLFDWQTPRHLWAYLIGFGFFSCLLLFDMYVYKFKFNGIVGKVINWVARISYPLYVGNMVPGFVMFYFLMEQGINVWWAILVGFIYSLAMAAFIHKIVELPSLRLSKAIITAQEEKP